MSLVQAPWKEQNDGRHIFCTPYLTDLYLGINPFVNFMRASYQYMGIMLDPFPAFLLIDRGVGAK